MENSKNNIENLYSNTFGNFEDMPANDEWKALSSKLSKVNFLKFSFTTFNVFYLCTILALTASTAYLGVNNYILSSKNKSLEIQIEKLNHNIIFSNDSAKTTNAKQTNLLDTDNYVEDASDVCLKKVRKNSANTTISNQSEISNNPSPQVIIKSTVIECDAAKSDKTADVTNSEPEKADSSTVNMISPQKIKKVRKTVFIKQNLVVVKDSIVIYK